MVITLMILIFLGPFAVAMKLSTPFIFVLIGVCIFCFVIGMSNEIKLNEERDKAKEILLREQRKKELREERERKEQEMKQEQEEIQKRVEEIIFKNRPYV